MKSQAKKRLGPPEPGKDQEAFSPLELSDFRHTWTAVSQVAAQYSLWHASLPNPQAYGGKKVC